MISFRTMTSADIPAGLNLCRNAGWNQLSADWDLFLELNGEGCRVAVSGDGEVIGTVTTVNYSDHFSWVGMVLVDPAYRRMGVGTDLLAKALEMLRNAATIKLDATPAGRPIYKKLDFKDEYPISRMILQSARDMTLGLLPPRRTTAGDLSSIFQLDEEVFGAKREQVLQSLFSRSPEMAFVAEGTSGLQGFCFGRRGHLYTHIGPVIARDDTTARLLALSAISAMGDGPVMMDVPHHSENWLTQLSDLGFVEQRTFTRMYRGANRFPGIPSMQYAILGPEFG